MAKHPIQPLELDKYKVLRFKENKIVTYLLDKGPFDMNDIARGDFSQEDREQFAQLIGYSLSGAGDLSYMSDEVLTTAYACYEGSIKEKEARENFKLDLIDEILDKARAKVINEIEGLLEQ